MKNQTTSCFEALESLRFEHLCQCAASFVFRHYREGLATPPVPVDGMYSARRVLRRTSVEMLTAEIPIIVVRLRKKVYYDSYCRQYAEKVKLLLQAEATFFEAHDTFFTDTADTNPHHIFIDNVDVSGEDVVIQIVFLNRENVGEYINIKGENDNEQNR